MTTIKRIQNAVAAFALVLALGGGHAARATILFAGGEDTSVIGLTNNNGIAPIPIMTTAGYFRANFAREALEASNGNTVNHFETPTFTASSNFWTSFELFWWGGGAGTNQPIISFKSPDGVTRIILKENGTSDGVALYTQNSAGAQTQIANETTQNLPKSALSRVDVYINYTCSAAGEIQIWIQGAKVIDYAGNPCTDSATSLNQAMFWDVTNWNNATLYSEIIIADTNTQGMSLLTLAPQALGATCNWDQACTLANINKTSINDSTYNASATGGQIQEFTIPTTVPAGSWTVQAICQDFRAEVGASGPLHLAPVAHVGSTDYTLPNLAPATAFSNLSSNCWVTNPATSSAWTIGDINSGLQFGAESEP